MKAFSILKRAFASKKNEMVVSLQFLTIVTLILSFILFFVEHEAQPEVYENGWTSVVWAFAQYIGDPGGFADTPPITLTGRIIACVIGILGIAIFAVPAGLIGSGFSDVMEMDEKRCKLMDNIQSIVHTFKFDKDLQHTNLFFVPRYKEMNTVVTRKFIPADDIIKAVKESDCLHLYNTANAMNAADHPEDKIVIINYKKNTP
jgi:voltage-gated potassium channel